MDAASICIHTEVMDRTVRSIFETNCCRWYCKTNALVLRCNRSSYSIKRLLSSGQAYDKLSGKEVW